VRRTFDRGGPYWDSNHEWTTWDAGVLGTAGFEWFFLRRLSAGTQAGVALHYARSEEHSHLEGGIGRIRIEQRFHTVYRNFYLNTTQLQLTLTYYF
jgi:hypothetical protein